MWYTYNLQYNLVFPQNVLQLSGKASDTAFKLPQDTVLYCKMSSETIPSKFFSVGHQFLAPLVGQVIRMWDSSETEVEQ